MFWGRDDARVSTGRNTMNLSLRRSVGLLFLVAIAGCGPIYDTRYTFEPPRSAEGRACTFQCNQGKLQCQQIEDLNKDRCEQESRRNQQDCEYNIRITKNRSPKWYECGSDSCSADYDRCEESYRSCYESCGGRVNATTVCVSNCDKIPPPPTSDSGSGKKSQKSRY